MNSLEVEFRSIVTMPDENINLVEAALVIARSKYPELDPAVSRRLLDSMATELQRQVVESDSVSDKIDAINHYLFRELGFAGNLASFNDPRNSYLNDVLERKLGIPLTLSLIYMVLGNRIGLPVRGVSFPGHFLVKLTQAGREFVIDPFSSGLILDDEELQGRLENFSHSQRRNWSLQDLLKPATNHEILARMLRNLKNIYTDAEDCENALKVINLLLVLAPGSVVEIRDRAGMYDQMNCFRAAIEDYQQYLMLSPQVEDMAYVQSRLMELKSSVAQLH